MNRETWNLIKNNKNFNVRVLRRGVTVLIGSLILNLVLGALIFYEYIGQPDRAYYATNGVTPPELLKGLSAPNYSSVPLLEPDPVLPNLVKVIPQ